MPKILKASTARGQAILASASHYEGYDLYSVYGRYSYEKEKAYNYCLNKYLATEKHSGFAICSHNTWAFTCSWCGLYDGEQAVFYETAQNSYIVLCNK